VFDKNFVASLLLMFLLSFVVMWMDFRMIKFFDIQSYDMINMINVSFVPGAVCWLKHAAGGWVDL